MKANISKIINDEVNSFISGVSAPSIFKGLAVGFVHKEKGCPVKTPAYFGTANSQSQVNVTSNTLFEIGSITKLFTATMMAALTKKRYASTNIRFKFSQTVQSAYDDLGVSVTLPIFTNNNNRQFEMTLLDLATYASGIPDKSPTNLPSIPGTYSTNDMYTYLQGLSPRMTQPGSNWRYVNTNFAILADLITRASGLGSYEDLLRLFLSAAKIPMPNTGVIPRNSPQIPNLAQGYDNQGNALPNYSLNTWPAFNGAGAIYSNIDDMLSWVAFNLGLLKSDLNSIIPITQRTRYVGGYIRGTKTGLGWFISKVDGRKWISKDGVTGGFQSYIALVPKRDIGVVILCNSNFSGISPNPIVGLSDNILTAVLN